MKILQLVQKPQRRGAEIFASQLSGRLQSMGHEVRTVYLYPHSGGNVLPLSKDDAVLGGQEHHFFEKFPGIHPWLLWRLVRLIAKWKPDVVQVNGGRTLKYGAAAAWFTRQAWVLISRSIGQPRHWLRGRLHYECYARFVIPRLHGVVGVSAATLQELTGLYKLSVPVVRIPRAIDPTALVPASSRSAIRKATCTPGDARVVLYVGSLTREKRVDRLFRVINNVRRHVPNVHLWIVGEGDMRQALEAEAAALSLGDRIRFVGGQKDVASYMVAADVLALTSETEGLPGVILEAGLLRRTVVATSVGGVGECVLDGETGILVEPSNEAAFAEALSVLLQHPEDLKRLGDSASDWIERNFTVARIAAQYLAFYEVVLSR